MDEMKTPCTLPGSINKEYFANPRHCVARLKQSYYPGKI